MKGRKRERDKEKERKREEKVGKVKEKREETENEGEAKRKARGRGKMPSRRVGLVEGKDRATVAGPCLIYLIVESHPLFSAVILTEKK